MKHLKVLFILVIVVLMAIVGCSKREAPTQLAQKIEPTEVAFGTVKVATIPAKGIVVFDGDTLGPAPVERDSLAPAPYVYQILSPDTAHQDSAEAFFEVKAGQNNLMVRLKLKSGEIEIDTTATDSAGLLAVYAVEYETEVPLSGVKVFTKEGWPAVLNPWPAINQNLTPINFNQVAPNSYTLVGIKSGYDTTAVSVIVEAGKSETAYLVMHKSATPDTTTPPDTTIVPPDTTQPCEQQGATFKAINDRTGEEITYVKVELDNGSGWKLYGPGYHWLEVGNYTARFTDDTGQYEGPVEEDFVIDSCQVTQVVVEMQKKTNDPGLGRFIG